MKCPYCQVPCELHLWDVKYSNPLHTQWICKTCDVYLQVWEDGIHRIHWDNIKVGKRVFKIRILPMDRLFYLYLSDGKKPESWEIFFSWDFIPQSWTPKNASAKLKNILPYL